MNSVEEQINRRLRERTWDQVWMLTQSDIKKHLIRDNAQREVNDLVWNQIQGEITNTIFAQLMKL